jgi:hypothetical protein
VTDRKRCTHCGRGFDTSDWYPTATRQGPDGIEIYSFCSAACRNAWRAASEPLD